MACTGDLPPNCKSGQAFINDPTLHDQVGATRKWRREGREERSPGWAGAGARIGAANRTASRLGGGGLAAAAAAHAEFCFFLAKQRPLDICRRPRFLFLLRCVHHRRRGQRPRAPHVACMQMSCAAVGGWR
eukprot:scaffold2899_cov106-Isochrysis_galbana.AAC.9